MNLETNWEYKIPLRNRQKEIVGYALLDKDDYEKLKDYTWSLSKRYANNWKIGYMHRYLLNAPKNSHVTVDHINNNKLDNRRENLQLATKSEQSQNQTRRTKSSESQFLGVSWDKRWKKWRTMSGGKTIGYWEKELHAGWGYNVYVKAKHNNPKTNDIEKPDDFVEWTGGTKTKAKYTGVHFKKDLKRWTAIYGRKYIGSYTSEQEAYQARCNYVKTVEEQKQKKPIQRNKDGIAFISVTNNQTNTTYEMLLDDEDYHKLKNTHVNYNNGYGRFRSDGKHVMVHRYLLDVDANEIVDHINLNKLDNRRSNLRIATHSENSQNRNKSSGSSKYVGVSKIKNDRWRAYITHDKKQQNLGYYDIEEDAAKAYNETALRIFGQHAFVNKIEE